MPLRTRKLIGTVLLVLLLAGWIFLAMAFVHFALASDSRVVAAIYYLVAGLGWVIPAMPLVSWMVRPQAPQ